MADRMRAEFNAWVRDRGCDTDGAWSAWQACWNLLHAPVPRPIEETVNRCGCNWWLTKPCPARNCPWQGKRPVDSNAGVPVVAAANPALNQGPCTVCGKPWRDHGTAPVYEDHNYTPSGGVPPAAPPENWRELLGEPKPTPAPLNPALAAGVEEVPRG